MSPPESKKSLPSLWRLALLTVAPFLLICGILAAANPLGLAKAKFWVHELAAAILVIVIYAIYRRKFSEPVPIAPRVAIPPVFIYLAPCLFAIVNISGHPLVKTPETTAIWNALIGCLSIGLAEELLFRGYLFDVYRRVRPPIYLLVSSVIFGIGHFQQGLSGILVTMTVGGVLGLARVAGMPLYMLVIIHALVDLPVYLPTERAPYIGMFGYYAIVYSQVLLVIYLVIPRSWAKPRIP